MVHLRVRRLSQQQPLHHPAVPFPASLVLDRLERLRECSLVLLDADTSGEICFRLFETLREYADERLTDDERIALRDRHAEFCTEVAEDAGDSIYSADHRAILARLDAERERADRRPRLSEPESGDGPEAPTVATQPSECLEDQLSAKENRAEAQEVPRPRIIVPGSAEVRGSSAASQMPAASVGDSGAGVGRKEDEGHGSCVGQGESNDPQAREDAAEALKARRSDHAYAEGLARLYPDDPERQRDLWRSCCTVANAMERAGQCGGYAFWRQAYELLSRMERAGICVLPEEEAILRKLEGKIRR